MLRKNDKRQKRKNRIRKKIRINSKRLRLSVFRSNKNIYAQIIDDKQGKTLVAASSVEKEFIQKHKSGADVGAAGEIGKVIAKRAIKVGIKDVVFDRGGYLYHGRVKAFGDAARENGLSF